ncbi:MAG: matrixin family metalloprotease [Chloroflexi bacterium]|nr:matrixin family metalloprotease [Chloroflexota bacterium]
MLWAMSRWSSLAGQTFSFAYAGAAAQPPDVACEDVARSDGINTVSFVATLPADVLGSTCVLSTRRAGVVEIVEFDMVFSAAIPWSTAAGATPAGQLDLYSTALHEFGHALGLGHSDDPTAVMKPAIHDGEQGRNFSNDDLAAIFSLYGTGTGATPLATPGAPPAAGSGVFQLRLGQVASGEKK